MNTQTKFFIAFFIFESLCGMLMYMYCPWYQSFFPPPGVHPTQHFTRKFYSLFGYTQPTTCPSTHYLTVEGHCEQINFPEDCLIFSDGYQNFTVNILEEHSIKFYKRFAPLWDKIGSKYRIWDDCNTNNVRIFGGSYELHGIAINLFVKFINN